MLNALAPDQLFTHAQTLSKYAIAYNAEKYVRILLPITKPAEFVVRVALSHPDTRRMILAATTLSRFFRRGRRRLTNDSDPISLDPIDPTQSGLYHYTRGTARYAVDAVALARYISATGITRDPLANVEFTDQELRRLDQATSFNYLL